MKPIVAIVGRPNVGKSTLFNRVSRERRALVEDVPGVTRDRLYNEVTWNDRTFILIDTGGFDPTSRETLLSLMREQTQLAIDEADAILFVLDARDGLTPVDHETAERLRRTAKPVHYVVNKVDGPRHDALAMEFHELGAPRLHAISALHGRGVADLLDEVTQAFRPDRNSTVPREDGIRVAVVGRPNVGKSSLVNRLCGEARILVSAEPGTTHDAVDTEIRWHGRPFTLIDTAGIRRKARTRLPLEKYSAIKALKSIERCHVALLLLDAGEGITDQDARIGRYIVEAGRGCVLVVNKWDLVIKDDRTYDQYVGRVLQELAHLNFAPVVTISALSGQRVGRLLTLATQVHESCGRRVPTPRLNQQFQAWLAQHPHPLRGRQRVKFYYIAQPGVHPPTFVAVCNRPEAVSVNYRRYLINRIREHFDFTGAPIRLYVKPRNHERSKRPGPHRDPG